MRWLIWGLLIAAVAVALTMAGSAGDGYLLIVSSGHRIELSLNFALILLVTGFLGFYLLTRLAVAVFGLPAKVAAMREARRSRRARESLYQGLREFFAGRFARSEKSLARAVALGEPADIGAVVAARAAHELRATERRDQHLAALTDDPEAPDIAKISTVAGFLLDANRQQEALEQLDTLPKKHTAALRLELRARQQLGQWDKVPALVDQLEKRHLFDDGRADAEREYAWRKRIEAAADDGDALRALWKQMPDRYRRRTAVAAVAAKAFCQQGMTGEAQSIIEHSLEQEWDSDLLDLYGGCRDTDALRQIERAEKWLPAHRDDSVLLLALGRLCAHQQLWGKAQSYFEASLSVEPSYSAHLALAELHDRLERVDEARRHYRESLNIAVAQLRRMSGGRRRTTR